METLFPLEPISPPGFFYFRDFLSGHEENELLRNIGGIERQAFIFHGYEAKRRVASFGYDYSFGSRALRAGKEIPTSFTGLIGKVAAQTQIAAEDFSELLITEYPPGAVINWHRDAFPFEVIAGISLAAPCIFRFRPHEKSKQSRQTIFSLTIEPRSLYIIRGEARTDWQHSTLPVSSRRFSITLRTLSSRARAAFR